MTKYTPADVSAVAGAIEVLAAFPMSKERNEDGRSKYDVIIDRVIRDCRELVKGDT